jgi:thioredoxin reductase (NADPH)
MERIKVYGAPWCPDCRRAKKFLGEHRVPYDWTDIDEDRAGLEEVERLQNGGRTIPAIVFADGSILLEPSDEELARKLGLTLAAERPYYDLAIVGGGPAGLAAAMYAAREGIDTLVIDKSAMGGQAGVTEKIDNYPGFPDGIGGGELADRFVAQAKRYGVELLSAVSVEQICPDESDRTVGVKLSSGQEVCASAVIVATGSTYRRLGVPGEDDLIGAGVHFCATCDGPFYRGAKELLVVGGGNSGLEEGLFLSQFADRIRIVQRAPELTASRLVQDKVREQANFDIHTSTSVTELVGKNGKLHQVKAHNSETGEDFTWEPAGAFVFIGLDPNTGFLGDSLALDEWGFIVTDDSFATSMPGVFAAGDVRADSTKQLGSAVGDGIAALLQVRAYLRRRHEMRTVRINA